MDSMEIIFPHLYIVYFRSSKVSAAAKNLNHQERNKNLDFNITVYIKE